MSIVILSTIITVLAALALASIFVAAWMVVETYRDYREGSVTNVEIEKQYEQE